MIYKKNILEIKINVRSMFFTPRFTYLHPINLCLQFMP